MIRLFRFLKPYRWYIAIVLVFAACNRSRTSICRT